jgi:hypothetical protein
LAHSTTSSTFSNSSPHHQFPSITVISSYHAPRLCHCTPAPPFYIFVSQRALVNVHAGTAKVTGSSSSSSYHRITVIIIPSLGPDSSLKIIHAVVLITSGTCL